MTLTPEDVGEVHRLAFEAAPDAILLLDDDGSLVLANAAARELAARGSAVSTLRDAPAYTQFRDDLRVRGRASFDARIGERLFFVHGRTLGTRALLFVRDVTVSREAEEDVTRLWGLASVGALTASLVHDVGNLMTPLAALGDALAVQGAGGIAEATAEELRRTTATAGELVRDVRGFLRGRSRPPEPLEVNRVLRELQPLIVRVVGQSVSPSLVLDSEDGSVIADRTRLERAVINLVANARDAMAAGGRLTIRTYSAWFDGDAYVALSVTDEGAGMTPSERERAFDPLFTTKSEGSGTGLGLWMVRRFVREARGRLSIQSEVGKGTQITLYLPRAGSPFS